MVLLENGNWSNGGALPDWVTTYLHARLTTYLHACLSDCLPDGRPLRGAFSPPFPFRIPHLRSIVLRGGTNTPQSPRTSTTRSAMSRRGLNVTISGACTLEVYWRGRASDSFHGSTVVSGGCRRRTCHGSVQSRGSVRCPCLRIIPRLYSGIERTCTGAVPSRGLVL